MYLSNSALDVCMYMYMYIDLYGVHTSALAPPTKKLQANSPIKLGT